LATARCIAQAFAVRGGFAVTHSGPSRASQTLGVPRTRALLRYWATAIALLIAIVVRAESWLNCDVSWLLTLGERVLAGARPYVDFTEPNPPASILIYLPAILIGRLFGFAPELVVTLLIFAGVFLCLWMCSRILSDSEAFGPQDRPNLAALFCVLLLILPGDAFAQREHIALLALLPMLCVYVLRARGAPVETTIAVLVGLGGGIAIAIKPYFAFALMIPLAYVGWCRRRRGQGMMSLVLAPEHLAVAVTLAAYAGVIVALFSDYVRVMLPVVLAVYAPLRVSNFIPVLAMSVLLIAMNTAVARAVDANDFREPVGRVIVLAVLGFAIAMLAQGKGWQYHSYPAIALSLFLFGAFLLRSLDKATNSSATRMSLPRNIAFGAALFASLYAIESIWFLSDPSRVRLAHEVARLVPAHPRIASINGGPEFAFPLTRKLEGTPLWPVPFQWVSAGAERLLQSATLDPATRDRIARYAWADRQDLVQSIQTGRPDVILIGEGADERWALGHPEVAAALRAYRQVASVDGVEIWLPRTEPSAP
jgi:hypothetical protein